MARHKSRAFVLDARDYRETSKLIQLFCENEGRISVIGKGLRSPKNRKAQAADTFNLVQIGYSLKDGETLGLLTAIEAEEVYSGIRLNLVGYALAGFWFEVLKVVSQARMAAPELFALTGEFLRHVQNARHFDGDTACCFLQLTSALGFALDLRRCAHCGRADSLQRVELGSGAAICGECPPPRGRALPYTENLKRVIDARNHVAQEALTTGDAMAFLTLFSEYLGLHLDHRFQTFSFVRQVLQHG